MGTSVRRAEARDRDFVVQVMLTAAKSHLETSVYEVLFDLDPSQLSELYGRVATSERTHWCHLSKFWIAEVDDERAGAMCGFDPFAEGNDALGEALLPLLVERGKSGADVEAIIERTSTMESCTPKPFPAAWGVENVAVEPGFRGRGIADHLFDAVLAEGRSSGYERAQIMCLNGNRRAETAWKRAGFDLKADYTSPAFQEMFGCPGLKLLVRDL